MYCTVLYCTVLHRTALHCTVLVLHCTVLHRTALHCTVLYCNIKVAAKRTSAAAIAVGRWQLAVGDSGGRRVCGEAPTAVAAERRRTRRSLPPCSIYGHSFLLCFSSPRSSSLPPSFCVALLSSSRSKQLPPPRSVLLCPFSSRLCPFSSLLVFPSLPHLFEKPTNCSLGNLERNDVM